MQAYLARRLLALVPALFFASLIVFVIVRLMPGSIIDLMLSQNDVGADKLSRDQLDQHAGSRSPDVAAIFSLDRRHSSARRFRPLALAEHAGCGASRRALPITFELGLMAMIVALIVALPIGVYSAIRQDTAGDYLTRSFSILMLAVPSFWIGTMVMVFPSIWWGWSPQVKFVPFTEDPLQSLRQMILPALILGTALSAVTMRLTRTMMLEVLRQDYIRTAWAKGLSEPLVVIRHALRNALIPVVTLIGLQAPMLIGGAVIVEQIFVIPGMGLLLLDAVSQRDYPIITGVFLVIGVVGDADQSRRRPELRPARSQGEVPLMAIVIDIPAPSSRAERNGVIRFIVRLFREKPLGAAGGVIFILFLLCGIFADVLAPYGFNQISPRQPPEAAVMGLSVRHRQSRPRHALALPLRRPDLGDHRPSPPHRSRPSSPS